MVHHLRAFGLCLGLAGFSLPPVMATPGLGQPMRSAEPHTLVLRPGTARFASGDPIWWLELRQGSRPLHRWAAATGLRQMQRADRRWSPGNGAPLPAGAYRVGRPEPWGGDLWIALVPLFKTSRSGLGIHHCFPGVGCICLPQRAELDQLAGLIRRHGVRSLQVLPP